MTRLSKLIFILLICVIPIGVFFSIILYQTGFFREIKATGTYQLVGEFQMAGAEDLTINYEDDLMFISSDDRKSMKLGKEVQGKLYSIDLKDSIPDPTWISSEFDKPFHPHGLSIWRLDSMTYKIFVINHVRNVHSIEVFQYSKAALLHLETIKDDLLISPNDLVAVNENQFYVTNDHGTNSKMGLLLENYLGLRKSNVIYYDGESFAPLVSGISYANGINYDPGTKRLYVSSTRGFLVNEYQLIQPGRVEKIRSIEVGTGVDNLEWDENGNLWSGCHPSLMSYNIYAQQKKIIAPSEVIKITLGENPVVRSIFVDHGNLISGSSVAALYHNELYLGSVMDSKLLILDLDDN